ncbi:MAG: hypothetical protein PHI35_07795 [Victivallaceae bacterium]|nr:hypothetical protein [Victivallaceae bacterium]
MKNHYFCYRSFLPEFDAMKRFAAAGVDTACFLPGNTTNSLGEPYSQYPAVWRWYGEYDFESLDRQIADICRTGLNKTLICIVDLNSPAWLARQLSCQHKSSDSFTHLTECLANPDWRRETMRYMIDFLDYCEKKHSGVIKAYVLACGHTDEWFDHNGEICGLDKGRAYAEWRRQHGLPAAEPPSAVKMNTPDYDGLLFDPAKSGNVLEYRRFCSELVGDAILGFAAEARRHIRETAEIGVFYGYITTRLGAAESAHLAYERVVNSPDIDFMISPGSYGDRAMGGGGGWLGCSGTEKIAGKIHMHECDQRTHTHNRDLTPFVSLKVPFWPDTKSDVAGIKREFALALLKRSSLWWFDMWGGFYEEPILFENFRHFKELYDRYIELPSEPVEEVALIIDPEALVYFDQRSQRQKAFQPDVRKQLNRLGAPFESYCLNDLPHIPNPERIKLFIFVCQWEITPAKAALIERYALNANRTVLWLYAPGLSDGQSLAPARIGRWTGGATEHASGLTLNDMGNWQAAYLRNPAELTPAMLKELAKKAGVHIYCDAEIPIYADQRFLAAHTATGGRLTLLLPNQQKHVTELFSGKTAAVDSDRIEWIFESPDTVLFEME